MKAIEVAEPGLLTTVQDLGRPGFGPIGVSPSGAADAISFRLGNLLVGNEANTAALEMTLLGGKFHFSGDCVVSLTGSDFGGTLDGEPVQVWTRIEIRRGQTLSIGHTRSGARCYLCVRGGISVPAFLGSASTHLLSGLGGFEGRPLRKGDILPIGSDASSDVSPEVSGDPRFERLSIPPDAIAFLAARKTLRVTPGPQGEWFPSSARRLFHEKHFRVAEDSNRIGIRLEGEPIPCPAEKQMITEGVPLGAIQVPPSGQPIIVFVEQQTTGGYPKIANVIAADLPSLGQLRPRDEIRFEQVTFGEAQSLLREQEQRLRSLVGRFEHR